MIVGTPRAIMGQAPYQVKAGSRPPGLANDLEISGRPLHFLVSWRPQLEGAFRDGRISLKHRLIEPSDGIEDVSLLIDLRENPTDISGLRLEITGILEEVTDRRQQLRLHAPDNIRELFVRRAARPKRPQCVTDARIGLIRV
jgi:hypothetical protein